jgi:segregation and condensation protein B
MPNPISNNSPIDLAASVEALLFVAPGPVSPLELSTVLSVPLELVESTLDDLAAQCEKRGIRLQRSAGKVQFTTAPEMAELIEKFLGLEASSHLSRAALEALAIVAFEQPVTRPQIDAIRGVSSDGVLKSLLSKGLIQEVGRAESPGRPILYATTPEFLQNFGLSSLNELPPLTPISISGMTEEANQ